MAVKFRFFRAWKRDVEKKMSRELDAYLLAEGSASKDRLAVQNDFFASLDLSRFKVSAIGGRRLSVK